MTSHFNETEKRTVYSGGDHVQSLHPSAALGPQQLPCSHMFFVHINTCSVRPCQANNTNNI